MTRGLAPLYSIVHGAFGQNRVHVPCTLGLMPSATSGQHTTVDNLYSYCACEKTSYAIVALVVAKERHLLLADAPR